MRTNAHAAAARLLAARCFSPIPRPAVEIGELSMVHHDCQEQAAHFPRPAHFPFIPPRLLLSQEQEAYVPRLACHHSLPVGKSACRLHEGLRLSGLFSTVDTGHELSG